MNINLPNEESSSALAKVLANNLIVPAVFTFSGEIGSGKTTFIRALLSHLGVKDKIKSPSFSLVESYHLSNLDIHHFDFYRIHDETELEYIGFRDYFEGHFLCCIEWPEKAQGFIQRDLHFDLAINSVGRLMKIKAESVFGESMLKTLAR